MAEPWVLIQEGRGWLVEGESPEAVAEEALENASSAGSDIAANSAWLAVAAQAELLSCSTEAAVQHASEAVAGFIHVVDRRCQVAAACVLVDAHLSRQNWGAAVEVAATAVDAARKAEDASSEATALLQLAKARLVQNRDPRLAASTAMAASKVAKDVGEGRGVAEGLRLAAEAHLLYEPEQALALAKEAVAAAQEAGEIRLAAESSQVMSAAKAQLATSQQVVQATSLSTRGDIAVKYTWPEYAQQRGERPLDPFATYGSPQYTESRELDASKGLVYGEKDKLKRKDKAIFMRKAFAWTNGRSAADQMWYRQEMRFVPHAGHG